MAKKRGRKIYKNSRRKKRAALLIQKLLALAAVPAAIVFIVIILNEPSDLQLIVDSTNYSVLSDADEAEPVIAISESGLQAAEEEEEAIDVFALKDTYPIEMEIRSKYALVYDVLTGEILYAKDADEKLFPASVTKILTSAVVLENVPRDFIFTVGDEQDLVNPGSSLAFVNKGNQLDLEMMIDAMMIPSGNDAAYAAAANIGRRIYGRDNISSEAAVEAFVDEMNRTAEKIGADNTHFANPDGFHDDGHYTTAIDLLKIILYAKDKELIKESAKKTYQYTTFLTGEAVEWENSNKLIQEYSDCYYTYATGMKTGMTDMSGYCVAATAERFGHEVVCIVMGAEASDIRWNDAIALLDASYVHIRNNY
jgi:D-alanyl-D-alanine carboxypeptidase (penicillin-binding protein 5/6)